MSYFLVQANAIVREGAIPETFIRPNGTTVMGYNLRTDLHVADGWLPGVLVGSVPTLLQTGTRVRTIFADRVEESWTNIVANPTAVNLQTIQTALTAALAQIDTDRTTLTGALTTANSLATATIANVGAAQTAIRAIGGLFQNLLPALSHSADNQKRLIRIARGALDASD